MVKKLILFVVLSVILLIPNNGLGQEVKTIVILVDQLSFQDFRALSLNEYSAGLINLKSRPPYGERELYSTINTGRKLGSKDFPKLNETLIYLGDLTLTSSIGSHIENLLIGDKNGEVDYLIDEIRYEYTWLKEKTDYLLTKSNLLLLSYDFQANEDNLELLGKYIENFKDNRILLIPKKVASEDAKLLNTYLVPLVYIHGNSRELLTSKSTKRQGFLTLEDMSHEIKKPYTNLENTGIGKDFQGKVEEKPIVKVEKLYEETISLLIIAYVFHGLIYIGQGLLGAWLLINKAWNRKLYFIYGFLTTNILISLILGLFNFHRNVYIYIIMNLVISFFVTWFIQNRKLNIIKLLSVSTYSLIVIGICLYPRLIYNSFIGFNNLIYGARYYGLNNGIMGILLISSILIFFSFNKNEQLNRRSIFLGLLLGIINFIVLSGNIGANTGGFITSVFLFLLIVFMCVMSKSTRKRRIVVLFILGLCILALNILSDILIGEKTHALELLWRIRSNGVEELTMAMYFKLKESLKLLLLPPFSLVVVTQIFILKKLREIFKESKELKKQAIIIMITSLIGFILNDTGVITFIYMTHYLIFYIMSCHPEAK